MQQKSSLDITKQIGMGLAFVLFPAIFVFAFGVHPNLFSPRILGPEEMIWRAHHNNLLQFGHLLVTLSPCLLIAIALQFNQLLKETTKAWFGWIGAVVAIFGALILAVDKGALCLTMSAMDTISEAQFSQALPGVLAMFNKAGYLWLLWGIVCLPAGFAIQSIGLIKSRVLPRWQSTLFLTGALLVSTPDGMEIINLTASILMAIALIPYGINMIRKAPNIMLPVANGFLSTD